MPARRASQREEKTLNESPSEKEGKFRGQTLLIHITTTLNESPSEKEGKFTCRDQLDSLILPSMKVPPKRKGNPLRWSREETDTSPLNESPSEKEGK